MNPADILDYVTANPFRPYRIRLGSDRTIDVQEPQMVRVGKKELLVFSEGPVHDEWEMVPFSAVEALELLESARPRRMEEEPLVVRTSWAALSLALLCVAYLGWYLPITKN